MKPYSTLLHAIEGEITFVEAGKPVRTPVNKAAQTQTKINIEWLARKIPERISRKQERAGCFVLLTSIPLAGNDAMLGIDVFKTYKGQYAVEQNFAFLKDPLIVNDIFLKTPGRIDALAMILIIALMAVRLMQLRMREYLEAEGKSVVGLNDKLTDESTYYAFMCAMRYVQIIVYEGRARLMNKNQDLTDKQRAYLEALGLDETVFFDSTALPRAIISLNSSE